MLSRADAPHAARRTVRGARSSPPGGRSNRSRRRSSRRGLRGRFVAKVCAFVFVRAAGLAALVAPLPFAVDWGGRAMAAFGRWLAFVFGPRAAVVLGTWLAVVIGPCAVGVGFGPRPLLWASARAGEPRLISAQPSSMRWHASSFFPR